VPRGATERYGALWSIVLDHGATRARDCGPTADLDGREAELEAADVGLAVAEADAMEAPQRVEHHLLVGAARGNAGEVGGWFDVKGAT